MDVTIHAFVCIGGLDGFNDRTELFVIQRASIATSVNPHSNSHTIA